MQRTVFQGLSARSSVRLSNTWIVTKRKKLCPHFYTAWKIMHPIVLTRRMVGGGRPFLPQIFWPNWPRWIKNADFRSIFDSYSASDVTLSKKVQITLIGSSLRTFLLASDEHRTLPRSSLGGGGSKTLNGRFPSKTALRFNKVCNKVSLCENCQRRSCRAFTGLSLYIRPKIVRGRRPLLWKKFPETETDQPPSKTPISNQYSLVAPRP